MFDYDPVTAEMYYDISVGMFRTIRGVRSDGYLLGPASRGYNEARAYFGAELVSAEYVEKNLVAVGPLDKFAFAERDPYSGAWKAKAVEADEPKPSVWNMPMRPPTPVAEPDRVKPEEKERRTPEWTVKYIGGVNPIHKALLEGAASKQGKSKKKKKK